MSNIADLTSSLCYDKGLDSQCCIWDLDDRQIKLSNDTVSCLDYEVLKEMGCRHFQAGCGVLEEGTALLHASILSDAGSIKTSIFGSLTKTHSSFTWLTWVEKVLLNHSQYCNGDCCCLQQNCFTAVRNNGVGWLLTRSFERTFCVVSFTCC